MKLASFLLLLIKLIFYEVNDTRISYHFQRSLASSQSPTDLRQMNRLLAVRSQRGSKKERATHR